MQFQDRLWVESLTHNCVVAQDPNVAPPTPGCATAHESVSLVNDVFRVAGSVSHVLQPFAYVLGRLPPLSGQLASPIARCFTFQGDTTSASHHLPVHVILVGTDRLSTLVPPMVHALGRGLSAGGSKRVRFRPCDAELSDSYVHHVSDLPALTAALTTLDGIVIIAGHGMLVDAARPDGDDHGWMLLKTPKGPAVATMGEIRQDMADGAIMSCRADRGRLHIGSHSNAVEGTTACRRRVGDSCWRNWDSGGLPMASWSHERRGEHSRPSPSAPRRVGQGLRGDQTVFDDVRGGGRCTSGETPRARRVNDAYRPGRPQLIDCHTRSAFRNQAMSVSAHSGADGFTCGGAIVRPVP